MRERVITILAMLLNASVVLSSQLLIPYLVDPRVVIIGRSWIQNRLWMEKTFFMTVSMGLIGIVTVIQWDRLFLSQRDFLNLRPLPVKDGLLFMAKGSSIAAFVILVSLVVNFFSTGVYVIFLSDRLKINPFYFGTILMIGNFLAGFFVFSLIALIQGILQVLFTPVWIRRISIYIQVTLLTLFIMLFIWFPGAYSSLPAEKEKYSIFFLLFPPFWFVGLSEFWTGNLAFEAHAWIAMMALLLPAALYYIFFSLGYNRCMRSSRDPVRPPGTG